MVVDSTYINLLRQLQLTEQPNPVQDDSGSPCGVVFGLFYMLARRPQSIGGCLNYATQRVASASIVTTLTDDVSALFRAGPLGD